MIAAEFALHPDELLYSAWARHGERIRIPNVLALRDHLFGGGSAAAVPDLPARIDDFLARLSPAHGLSATELVRSHTTLPYYTSFTPAAKLSLVVESMRGGGRKQPHTLLGSARSGVVMPRGLRFCPECIDMDRSRYREPFWRRAHQLPGVLVCADHAVPLFRTDAGAMVPGTPRLQFVPLGAGVAETGVPEAFEGDWLQPILDIAQASRSLCAQWAPPPDFVELVRGYRAAVLAAGFGRGRTIDYRALRIAVVERYGAPYLEQVGCTPANLDEKRGKDWLSKLCYASRVAQMQPLHHLLLRGTLGLSVAPSVEQVSAGGALPTSRAGVKFQPAPEWQAELARLIADRALTQGAIARALGVSLPTLLYRAYLLGISRKEWAVPARFPVRLEAEQSVESASTTRRGRRRAQWERLLAMHPGASRSELQRLNPAGYDWLRKNDAGWLEAHLPARVKPRGAPIRADWAARDAELLEAARGAVAAIHARPEPSRVTLRGIIRLLGVVDLHWGRRRQKAPLTAAYLRDAIERREAYARRRLTWALGQLLAEQAPIKAWAILSRARFDASRSGMWFGLAEQLVREHRALLAQEHGPVSVRGA